MGDPKTEVQHVVPIDEGDRWGVRAEGSEQPSKIFDMKMSAIAHAFNITEKYPGGKVIVHRKDGTFQSVNVTEETSKLLTMLRS